MTTSHSSFMHLLSILTFLTHFKSKLHYLHPRSRTSEDYPYSASAEYKQQKPTEPPDLKPKTRKKTFLSFSCGGFLACAGWWGISTSTSTSHSRPHRHPNFIDLYPYHSLETWRAIVGPFRTVELGIRVLVKSRFRTGWVGMT